MFVNFCRCFALGGISSLSLRKFSGRKILLHIIYKLFYYTVNSFTATTTTANNKTKGHINAWNAAEEVLRFKF